MEHRLTCTAGYRKHTNHKKNAKTSKSRTRLTTGSFIIVNINWILCWLQPSVYAKKHGFPLKWFCDVMIEKLEVSLSVND